MDFEVLLTMITPAIVSLFGIIAAVVKNIKSVKSIAEGIKEDTNIKQLKDEVRTLLDQNYELRNELKELNEAVQVIKQRGK